MSELGEIYSGLRTRKQRLRAKYGIPCPECVRLLPRTNPSILLPQQQCRIHRYRDPRPELTDAQWSDV